MDTRGYIKENWRELLTCILFGIIIGMLMLAILYAQVDYI